MKKALALILTAILSFSALITPIPAIAATPEDGGSGTGSTSGDSNQGTQAAILTDCANDSNGIGCILRLVVDIMSIGVGILGVIGITVVGIQYLTAGGDEGKTKKAKQRMFEIVIGLIAYVVIYAALRWLLPDFNGV